MTEHAQRGASSSERWLRCAGSVRESRGREDRTSIYAIVGTAAHEIAAQCLRDGMSAIEFLDRHIDVPEKTPTGVTIHKILCDEEMVEGVQLYLDLCVELQDHGLSECRVFVEQRVSLDELVPNFPEPLFGTCDFGLYKVQQRRLVVTDFKYGQGVIVEVENNTQAMYYALGLVLLLKDQPVDTIELIICQPRGKGKGGPIRRIEITIEALLDWADKELIPGLWATEDPDALLVPGEHCLFCRAAADCKALRAYALENAMTLFDDLEAMPIVDVKPTPPSKLTPEQLSQILSCTDTIQVWLRAVREHAFSLINAGVTVPNWKIVARNGHRRWVDKTPYETAAALVYMLGVPPDEIWNQKLKSPAQIETVVKKVFRGRNPGLVNTQLAASGLYEVPITGTTLAKTDDTRQEVLGVDKITFERLDYP